MRKDCLEFEMKIPYVLKCTFLIPIDMKYTSYVGHFPKKSERCALIIPHLIGLWFWCIYETKENALWFWCISKTDLRVEYEIKNANRSNR